MEIDLKETITESCFVFRGYNTTNLGKTPELLENPVYGPLVEKRLQEASDIASEETKTNIDLVARVRNREDTSLHTFPDAVALILATEVAQIDLLETFHSTLYSDARLAAGYSLGEIAATICGGVMSFENALRVPVGLASDCAELGAETSMGIVFSRTGEIETEQIERLCVEITTEKKGTIAISAYLSPNTLLLLGQRNTIERFSILRKERLPREIHFRKNPNKWPPLHTPIVRQRAVTDRASTRLQKLGGNLKCPCPPIVSLVTGHISYNDYNAREILNDWTDHPQQVWNAVCQTLNSGVRVIIHAGPEPNLFPATYKRLADNVNGQHGGSAATNIGRRLVSGMIERPWLASLLPSQASLLRAPSLIHITLEDWLLKHVPSR